MTTKFNERLAIVKAEIARLNKAIAKYEAVENRWSNKEGSAVRRSSMDLTRALADLRRHTI